MIAEDYLGGFTSGNMVRGRIRGYGLYFTTTRVIGVKRRGRALAGALVGSAIGGAIGAMVGQKLSRDEGAKMIQDLDAKKDFDLQKTDLQRIELKKPKWYKGGHVLFGPKYGDMIKVKVGTKRDFNNLKDLIGRFYPEAMSLTD